MTGEKHSERYPYKVYLLREEAVQLTSALEEKYGKMHLSSDGHICAEKYGIGMHSAESVWLGFTAETDAVLFRLAHQTNVSNIGES